MPSLADLKGWMAADFEAARHRGWKIKIGDETDSQLTLRIFSATYIFTIEADVALDYLHGFCQTRHNAPGTNHPLFADLPDGKLIEETWQAIIAEIKRFEIRPFPGPSL